MNSKQQEADRVRMERAVCEAAADLRQATESAGRIAMYDERLAAWESACAAAKRAHDAMRGYMKEYGLAGEVDE